MALLSQLISSAAVLGVSWNLFDHVFTLTQVEKCKVESRKRVPRCRHVDGELFLASSRSSQAKLIPADTSP